MTHIVKHQPAKLEIEGSIPFVTSLEKCSLNMSYMNNQTRKHSESHVGGAEYAARFGSWS